MKQPRLNWSNFELELMRYLIFKGFNRHQAGLRIGRTCAAVKRKMLRLSQPYLMRPLANIYSFEIEEYIKKRWAEGASGGVIQLELGAKMERPVTRNMVFGKLYRMGLCERGERLRRPKDRLHRPITHPRPPRRMKPRHPRPGPAPLPATIYISEPVGGRWNLQDNPGCHYPEGDSPDWWFCGAPTVDHSSYCGYHHSVCYQTKRFKQRPLVIPLPGAVGSPVSHPPPDLAGEPLQ